MARMHDDRSAGFTLIELMIVVAILGILASVAIPQFRTYQLTSKRAEAYANLSSLGKAQKAYFAEFNDYVFVASEPLGGTGQMPTSTKRDKSSIDVAFERIGWTPDGDVFFDYDTVTPAAAGAPCTCTEACFTAAAYGDLDDDGFVSVMIYAHPDAAGNFCDSWLAGNQSPPVNAGGRVFDQAARVLAADEF
ncbi:MAG: prepilin-type N-terminal cleavage/methylation domain-containing protein [Myxococcota bacterium]